MWPMGFKAKNEKVRYVDLLQSIDEFIEKGNIEAAALSLVRATDLRCGEVASDYLISEFKDIFPGQGHPVGKIKQFSRKMLRQAPRSNREWEFVDYKIEHPKFDVDQDFIVREMQHIAAIAEAGQCGLAGDLARYVFDNLAEQHLSYVFVADPEIWITPIGEKVVVDLAYIDFEKQVKEYGLFGFVQEHMDEIRKTRIAGVLERDELESELRAREETYDGLSPSELESEAAFERLYDEKLNVAEGFSFVARDEAQLKEVLSVNRPRFLLSNARGAKVKIDAPNVADTKNVGRSI